MRVVLTIIAVALVALLTTALFAPLFVDWSAHRSEIEARLGAIAGGRVALSGPITLRLLPVPYLNLGAGSAAGAGPDAPKLSFEKARLELALTKLASGKIRFTEIFLEKPVLTLTRGAGGSLNLPLAPAAEADAVGFDRLVARDGTIRIAAGKDAPAGTIEGVELDADAPSLAGPYHASGRFAGPGGAPVVFRLATEKAGPKEAPIRASVEAGPEWPAFEFDGALAFAGAKRPSLAGAATLTRTAAGPDGPIPWRVAGSMTADLDGARLANAEFRLGPEERAVRAEGSATLVAGAPARLTIAAKAKQANVDALLRRKGEDGVPPARALALIAGAFGPALEGAGPMTVAADLSAGDVILGSDTLSDLSANVSAAPDAPLKTRFAIGLPGRSRLTGDGTFETGAAARFKGAIDFMSADFALLRDWASEGQPDFAAGVQKLGDALGDRSLSVEGDVEASAVGLSGRNLTITLDRSTLTGALAFTSPVGADPGRLYLDLSSDSLDVDALPSLSAGAALIDSLDLSLSLRANTLHVAHVGEAAIDSGSLMVKVEKSGPKLTLDRLSVADLGGASVEAQGAYGPDGATATGQLSADRLGGFALLVSRLAPGDWSRTLAERAPVLSPASLDFEARGAGAGASGLVSLTANGTIGKTQARLTLEPGPKSDGEFLTLDLDSPDAGALLHQLGLGATAPQGGRGRIAISALGAWGAGYDVDASGAFAGAEVSARGRFLPTAEGDEARLFGSVKLKGANLAPLAAALGLAPSGGAIGPVEAGADLTLRGERWTVSRLVATVAGVRASGNLAYESPPEAADTPFANPDLSLAEEAVNGPAGAAAQPAPAAVTGELSLDRLPLADLLALALGPPQPAKAGALWSEAKFGPAPLSPPPAAVRVKVGTLGLGGGLAAQGFSTALRFEKGRLDLDDMAMTIDGGAASGRATLRRDRDAATLTGMLNAERLSILRPGFSGRVGGRMEFASTGKTPAALIAGLAGDGATAFAGAALKRSDPAAIERVVARAQAPEAPIDETDVAYAFGKELDRAALPIPDGPTPLTLSAGTIKLGPLPIAEPHGEASLEMSVDLMRLAVETRLTLSIPAAGLKFWSGAPPSATVTVLDALEAPKRQVDVAALSAGLATQAIARESDRIAAQEADIRERAFFNRRLKGERFMDKRAAEIDDWRVEQERLKGLSERMAAERAAEEKAAAEKSAVEKAAAEREAAEKAAVEKAAADRAAARAAAEKSEAARAFPQPELPPDVPFETAPIAKPPSRTAAPSSGEEMGANARPVSPPPAKPKPRPERAPPTAVDPTASGLY